MKTALGGNDVKSCALSVIARKDEENIAVVRLYLVRADPLAVATGIISFETLKSLRGFRWMPVVYARNQPHGLSPNREAPVPMEIEHPGAVSAEATGSARWACGACSKSIPTEPQHSCRSCKKPLHAPGLAAFVGCTQVQDEEDEEFSCKARCHKKRRPNGRK